MSVSRWLRRRLMSIPLTETSYEHRGFHAGASPSVRTRLELIGQTFVGGYHAALDDPQPAPLAQRLDQVELERRGFAYEGAAMALALLDELRPWAVGRFQQFLAGPGRPHQYMVHVGAGWAAARLPWRRRGFSRYLTKFDPLLRWLVADGYGFHQGFFHSRAHLDECKLPRGLEGYARRAFDFGLGRSLWFASGADPSEAARRIERFPADRQGDLWSGVGLASAYAGGVGSDGLGELRRLAGDAQLPMAQGAAFAAKARELAGNPTEHTELACQVLCGLTAQRAAAVTDECLADLSEESNEPAFEVWRKRIQRQLQRVAAPRQSAEPSVQRAEPSVSVQLERASA
jgi:hypothetical protein